MQQARRAETDTPYRPKCKTPYPLVPCRFHIAYSCRYVTTESQTITRKSASNLALAFILLPKPKQEAMAVLYAFCREVDDVADDESVPVEKRRAGLAAWREDVRRALRRRLTAISRKSRIKTRRR